jgi:hypothetical protein
MVGGVPGARVHVDGFHLSTGVTDPNDQPVNLSLAHGLAERPLSIGPVLRLDDVQKGNRRELVETPAEESLLGQARLNPPEAIRIESAHHIDD